MTSTGGSRDYDVIVLGGGAPGEHCAKVYVAASKALNRVSAAT